MKAPLVWKPEERWRELSNVPEKPGIVPLDYVYVIARNPDLRAVRVGQTDDLADRLQAHANNSKIVEAADGSPVVKWAFTAFYSTDGIERYLFERLDPLVGHRAPEAAPVECELPPGVHSGSRLRALFRGQKHSETSGSFANERSEVLRRLLNQLP